MSTTLQKRRTGQCGSDMAQTVRYLLSALGDGLDCGHFVTTTANPALSWVVVDAHPTRRTPLPMFDIVISGFITPALAQTPAPSVGGSPIDTFPFVLLAVMLIVFFLVIRPQQKRQKEFQEMITKVRRGDTVVTAGGFVGRVSKVAEGSDEVEVELNETMKVRVLRSTLLSVKSKTEPVKADSN